MAASDSLPIPRKNAAYRVVFHGLKNDGTLITSGTGMDSEISLDQGTRLPPTVVNAHNA